MACRESFNHVANNSKKDISDYEVVKEFADIVKTQERLDYLYLLTIADISGTNPELYTDWKDSLLKNCIYQAKLTLEEIFLKLQNLIGTCVI